MQKFLVTADHVAPQFACVDAVATVKPTGDGCYYAIVPGYGCSKSYRTPEAAISEMLRTHACTNIRIRAAS